MARRQVRLQITHVPLARDQAPARALAVIGAPADVHARFNAECAEGLKIDCLAAAIVDVAQQTELCFCGRDGRIQRVAGKRRKRSACTKYSLEWILVKKRNVRVAYFCAGHGTLAAVLDDVPAVYVAVGVEGEVGVLLDTAINKSVSATFSELFTKNKDWSSLTVSSTSPVPTVSQDQHPDQ